MTGCSCALVVVCHRPASIETGPRRGPGRRSQGQRKYNCQTHAHHNNTKRDHCRCERPQALAHHACVPKCGHSLIKESRSKHQAKQKGGTARNANAHSGRFICSKRLRARESDQHSLGGDCCHVGRGDGIHLDNLRRNTSVTSQGNNGQGRRSPPNKQRCECEKRILPLVIVKAM